MIKIKESLQKIDNLFDKLNESYTLPAVGAWPETSHIFDSASLWALKTALTCGRPLLIRGLPGTGKSQLARAAACILERAFISEVVNSKTESGDLLFSFDAVSRLGEAQAVGAAAKCQGDVEKHLDPLKFLSPGPLWWALDWESALLQFSRCHYGKIRPVTPQHWVPAGGSVVLIDEIDKAEADLPNGLLEVMANGRFTVPYLLDKGAVAIAPGTPPPLIIITTNEERELPAAFVRRTVVLNLKLPGVKEEFITYLTLRGKAHFGDSCSRDVMHEAASQVWEDRQAKHLNRRFLPGMAEYLDMLRALKDLAPPKEQLKVLQMIKSFMLDKVPAAES